MILVIWVYMSFDKIMQWNTDALYSFKNDLTNCFKNKLLKMHGKFYFAVTNQEMYTFDP